MSRRNRFGALITITCIVGLSLASAQQVNPYSGKWTTTKGQASSRSNLNTQEQHFLDQLAKGSQGEVQISQMVESKTNNPQVKEFAQRMVHDHTVLDSQVKQLLAKHAMPMPQPMTAEQKQQDNKLKNLSGQQLDRAYMTAQVKDHEQDVQKVSQQAKAANQLKPPDPGVAELSQEALPVLQEHLDLAKKVASEVGAG